MKKILLFAFAISLGSIAFALNNVDCSVEANCHCGFFSQSQFYGIKGCSSCPVRENGHLVKCESIANNGVVDRDCCWLNTPQRPQNHPWTNCYTNAYVILDPSYGPPWARRCVTFLNDLVSNGSNGGGAGAPNGGNGGNGGNIGHNGNAIKLSHIGNGGNSGHGSTGGAKKEKNVNKTAVQKPAAPATMTPKSVSAKQTPVLQSNDKKVAR